MNKQTALNFLAGAIVLIGIAARASDADGNWSWTTPGRNGGTPRESVLSLKTDGSTLTGKISTPGRDGKPVDTQIAGGKVDGNTIAFDVIRVFNGNTNKTVYTGTVANGTITGKTESVRSGETQSRDWVAKNAGDQSEAKAIV